MPNPCFGLTEDERRHELWLHQAMVYGLRDRVLGAFKNIGPEAAEYEENYRRARGQGDADWRVDEDGNAGDEAVEVANEYRMEAEMVEDRVTGLAIAGIFHLWEQQVRKRMLRLAPGLGLSQAQHKHLRSGSFDQLCNVIVACEWDLRNEPFFEGLHHLLLIANTVKHGDGESCERLLELRPDLFPFLDLLGPELIDEPLTPAESLHLSVEDLEACARSVQDFWTRFPDRAP